MAILRREVYNSRTGETIEVEIPLDLRGNKPSLILYDGFSGSNTRTEITYECYAPVINADSCSSYWKIRRTERYYIDGKLQRIKIEFPFGDSSYSYNPDVVIDGEYSWNYGLDIK